MSVQASETAFLSFLCPSCHQEIEAPAEMAGQESECPTCAAAITVPERAAPGTFWDGQSGQGHNEMSQALCDAMKSRTIRIELPERW
jgi:hypothetical protein